MGTPPPEDEVAIGQAEWAGPEHQETAVTVAPGFQPLGLGRKTLQAPGPGVLSGVASSDPGSGLLGGAGPRPERASPGGVAPGCGRAGRGGAGRARARALSLQHQEVGGPASQQKRPEEHGVAEEHEGEQLPQQLQHVDSGRGRHRLGKVSTIFHCFSLVW